MIRTLQPGRRCEVRIASLNGKYTTLLATDGHIYRAPLTGGQATRITEEDGSWHFLHGVSPYGTELAYVGIEGGDFSRPGRLMTIASDGGAAAVVDVPQTCRSPSYWPPQVTGKLRCTHGRCSAAKVRSTSTVGRRIRSISRSCRTRWLPKRRTEYVSLSDGTIRWGILGTGFIADLQTRDLKDNGFRVQAVGSRSLESSRVFADYTAPPPRTAATKNWLPTRTSMSSTSPRHTRCTTPTHSWR